MLLFGAVHHCKPVVIDFSPDLSICVAQTMPTAVPISPPDGSERAGMVPTPTDHKEHGEEQSQAAGSVICY